MPATPSIDLGALVREHAAERVKAGKAPTRADLAWLEATTEAQTHSSVEISRNAKGDHQFVVKVYDTDPFVAEKVAKEIVDRLRGTYPMANGTAGTPTKVEK